MIKSQYNTPMSVSEIHFRLLLSTLIEDDFFWETLKNGSDLRKDFDSFFLTKCRNKVYETIEEFGWHPHIAPQLEEVIFHWDSWSCLKKHCQISTYSDEMKARQLMSDNHQSVDAKRAFTVLEKVASVLEAERHEGNASPIKAFAVGVFVGGLPSVRISIYQIRQEGYEIQHQHYNWIWDTLRRNDYLTNEDGWCDFYYPPTKMCSMEAQRTVIEALKLCIEEGGFGSTEIQVWGI